MSTFGNIMRIIEVLVIYGVGFFLMTQKFRMRFSRKITFALCCFFYGGMMILFASFHLGLSKFLFWEFIIAFFVSVVLLLFLFKGNLVQIVTQCFVYWMYILCYKYLFARLGVVISGKENILDYAESISKGYFFEILESVLIIVVLGVLSYQMRGRFLIFFHYSRQYGMLLFMILLLCSLFGWWKFIYGWEQIADMAGVSVFCIFSAMILTYLYCSEKKARELQMEYNQKQMTEQYDMLYLNYEEKRRAIHDEIQQNALILEYLNQNRISEAKELLQLQTSDYQKTAIPCISGLSEVDLLLHHKKTILEPKRIHLQQEVSMHTNPFTIDEWCILFGNLMDNAIEAVEQLSEGEREIYLKLENRNKMFFLEIRNPYKDIMKRQDGSLISNKRNSRDHGIGIESCKNIVKKHAGEMVIKEDNHQFDVQIIIYSM